MRGIASALLLLLLAGCGGQEQSEQNQAEINLVPGEPSPPWPNPPPLAAKTCEKPGYETIRNKWWGGLTACQGDVTVFIEADSVNLGGPAVRLTVHSRSCPAGEGEESASFDRSVFDRPFEAQLAEIKRMVQQSLAEIEAACDGRSVHAPGLLGPEFDEAFLELATGTWLHLSAADRRKSWARSDRR